MKLIIDRFEGGFAVCETETKEFINIPKEDIPSEAKEGDVVVQNEHGYQIDTQETDDRKNRINKKLRNLFVD